VALVDIDLGAEVAWSWPTDCSARRAPPLVILISNHAKDEYAGVIKGSSAVGFLGIAALSGDAIRALLTDKDDDHQGGAVIEPPER
jgi:hypothetical protein